MKSIWRQAFGPIATMWMDTLRNAIWENGLTAGFKHRLDVCLAPYEETLGIEVLPEVRVQVKATRFRVPDVWVVLGDPGEEILTKPPFLCIEILSPEDRMSRMKERVNEYLAMGVPYIWVLDPQTKRTYVATQTEELHEVEDTVLRTANPVLEVPLGEIFR